MQVNITLSGPPGSGKTVLAEFIQRQLGTHGGVMVERHLGSQKDHDDPDRIVVQTSHDILNRLANTK